MMRRCRSVSLSRAARSNSMTRSAPKCPPGNQPGARARPNDRAPATRARCATPLGAGRMVPSRPTLATCAEDRRRLAAGASSFLFIISRPRGKDSPMNNLTRDQQTMLAAWQQHTHAEFVLKDADAALATMTESPYVFCIPAGTGAVGRASVRDFYVSKFLPCIPPDMELTSLSQTFGGERMVEEFVIRFTHTIEMGWMLPGV